MDNKSIEIKELQPQKENYFYNFDIFTQICNFLEITELMRLLVVNQTVQELVNSHFKYILMKNQLLNDLQAQQQSQDYSQLYKYFYCREILFSPVQPALESGDNLAVFRSRFYKQFLGKGIKNLQVGPKLTGFLSFDNILFLCQSSEIFGTVPFKFRAIRHVKKFFCNSPNLIYLTESGSVSTIFFDEAKPTSDLSDITLQWTIFIPVQDIEGSYRYVILLLKDHVGESANVEDQTIQNTIMFNEFLHERPPQTPSLIEIHKFKQEYKNEEPAPQRNICVWNLNELTEIDANDVKRFKKAFGYSDHVVSSYCVGINYAYFVNSKQNVRALDLSNFSNLGGLNPELIQFEQQCLFKQDSHIVQVFSGLNYYLALEMEEIPPLEEWDNKRVIELFQESQLDDYTGVITHKKINGYQIANTYLRDNDFYTKELEKQKKKKELKKLEKLKEKGIELGDGKEEVQKEDVKEDDQDVDDDSDGEDSGTLPNGQERIFLQDTLGMNKLEDQLKFQSLVFKYQKRSHKEAQLYGWGQNEIGQLGLPPCAFINYPQLIKLPEELADDKIKRVICGWKNTFLITESHKLYSTMINQKKEIVKEEVDTGKKKEKGQKGSSKISHEGEEQKEKEKNPQNPTRWVNISKNFNNLKDQSKFKISDVFGSKDFIVVLGLCYDTQILASLRKTRFNDEETESEKKEITQAQNAISRIQWDEKLNKDDFTVVYLDRFIGALEVPYNDFVMCQEIQTHRILKFKYNSEVVWDKKKRIDKFNQIFPN